MQTFIDLCTRINCPLSEEKMEWFSPIMIFLGTLLDGKRHCLCIAEEKKVKALNQIRWIRSKHTAPVKQIQCLTGILNFLNCAIVPGRVFTRCMYSKLKVIDKYGRKLKQYHHVSIGQEFKSDCEIWQLFWNTPVWRRCSVDLSLIFRILQHRMNSPFLQMPLDPLDMDASLTVDGLTECGQKSSWPFVIQALSFLSCRHYVQASSSGKTFQLWTIQESSSSVTTKQWYQWWTIQRPVAKIAWHFSKC